MKGLALLLAFALEAFMIGAISYAGFHLPVTILLRLLFGIGLPILVIIFWARYMAPKAAQRLPVFRYRLAKAIIFAVTAMLLALAGQGVVAVIFAIVAIGGEVLLYLYAGGRS